MNIQMHASGKGNALRRNRCNLQSLLCCKIPGLNIWLRYCLASSVLCSFPLSSTPHPHPLPSRLTWYSANMFQCYGSTNSFQVQLNFVIWGLLKKS